MKELSKGIYQRGECSFQVKKQVAGHRITKTFNSYDEALNWLKLKEVSAEVDPDAKRIFESYVKKSEIRVKTVASIVQDYIDNFDVDKKESSRATDRIYAKRVLDSPLARMSAYHVARKDIEDFVNGLVKVLKNRDQGKPLSDTSKWHYADFLTRVFNRAIANGLNADNPCSGANVPGKPKGRKRRLNPGERDRLFAELLASRNNALFSFVVLAIETASRSGELYRLNWEDLDIRENYGSAYLKDTKNGEDRVIPLSEDAIKAINLLSRPEKGGQLFPKSMRQAWEGACKRAGIDNLHIHDLRHEGISRFFEMGFSESVVAAVSGHKTAGILRDYTHLVPQQVARAINRAKTTNPE